MFYWLFSKQAWGVFFMLTQYPEMRDHKIWKPLKSDTGGRKLFNAVLRNLIFCSICLIALLMSIIMMFNFESYQKLFWGDDPGFLAFMTLNYFPIIPISILVTCLLDLEDALFDLQSLWWRNINKRGIILE